MTLSCYEVATLSKKAARGSGYSWGMAEEIGAATVALCRAGLDGPEVLARHLEEIDGEVHQTHGLRAWPVKQDRLCAFSLGCYLTDVQPDVIGVQINALSAPLFILPFLQSIADLTPAGFAVTVNDENYTVEHGQIMFPKQLEQVPNVARVVILENLGKAKTRKMPAFFPSVENKTLLRFAHRTYVPESEESRARGAG